jgi:hypothetical protein
MKTLKNNLSAIAFAIISCVAVYNTHTILTLTAGNGDIYLGAISSDSYQHIAQAFDTAQPAIF